MHEDRSTLSTHGRVESWQSIAALFRTDEATVQRWEKDRHLPIHRSPGESGAVFAYVSELLFWLQYSLSGSPPEGELSFFLPQAAGSSTFTASADAPALQAIRAARGRWLFWVAVAAFAVFLFLADNYHARSLAAAPAPQAFPAAVPGSSEAHFAPASVVSVDRSLARQQARELYLHGRYFWNRRTGDSLEIALRDFAQAIVHDSTYASAYAGLAATYELLPQYGHTPQAEAFPRAMVAARRAVALDPTSSEAHSVLGYELFFWEWKANAALWEFQHAIELDPNNAEAHHWYATTLFTLRRYPEAQAEIRRARELNPTSRSVLADQVVIDFGAGADRTICLQRLRELEHTEPDFSPPPHYVGTMLLDAHDFSSWIAQLRVISRTFHSPADLALTRAATQGWQHGGERAMFTEIRKLQEKTFLDGESSGFDLALTCVRLGDRSAAMQYLQAAFDAHDFRLVSLFRDPMDASLRGYPPYEQLRHATDSRLVAPLDAPL